MNKETILYFFTFIISSVIFLLGIIEIFYPDVPFDFLDFFIYFFILALVSLLLIIKNSYRNKITFFSTVAIIILLGIGFVHQFILPAFFSDIKWEGSNENISDLRQLIFFWIIRITIFGSPIYFLMMIIALIILIGGIIKGYYDNKRNQDTSVTISK